jgi:hypothetical protein
MKVRFKNLKKYFNDEQIETIKTFVQFIQGETSLKKDVQITFVDERTGPMTTGMRIPFHKIKVLASGRMLIDVLRTLSHEWVHEFEHQKLGLKEKIKIKDIGGLEENLANILSGVFMKKFQKEYPEFEKILYNEKK